MSNYKTRILCKCCSIQKINLVKKYWFIFVLNGLLTRAISSLGTDDTEIAGHTVTLFIEGFETSSTTLAFTFYELAMSAQWQERLRTEINEVLEKHDNKFTYEALQEMTLVDCAVQGKWAVHELVQQLNNKKLSAIFRGTSHASGYVTNAEAVH